MKISNTLLLSYISFNIFPLPRMWDNGFSAVLQLSVRESSSRLSVSQVSMVGYLNGYIFSIPKGTIFLTTFKILSKLFRY